MFTTFTLLVAASSALRLVLSWALKHRFGFSFGVPQTLAGALVVLSGLPDLIKPFAYPLPLSITLGALLPDLFRHGR
jgi:hypothetical protein